MTADRFIPGAWNAICDLCGRKFKSFEMSKTWQGWYVCRRCWEPRHPQDYVRGVQERPTPPWVRPPQTASDPPPRRVPALFTAPAEPRWRRDAPRLLEQGLPLVGREIDPFGPDVLFLLALRSGTITEDSVNHWTLGFIGSPAINGLHPYGSLDTLYMNGGGATNIVTGNDTIYDSMAHQEWCWEMWVKIISGVSVESQLHFMDNWQVKHDTANDRIITNTSINTGSYTCSSAIGSITLGAWHHVCWIRDHSAGGINGLLKLSIDGGAPATSAAFDVGWDHDLFGTFDNMVGGLAFSSDMAVAGLRMTVGTRRYTSGLYGYGSGYPFTPDPPKFPAVA